MDSRLITRVRALFRRPLMRVLEGLENPWAGVPDPAPGGREESRSLPPRLAPAARPVDWDAAIAAAKARAAQLPARAVRAPGRVSSPVR
jgi:hypothetical protein